MHLAHTTKRARELTQRQHVFRTTHGFTLIEVLLVASLVVLFIGGVVLSLRGPLDLARFEHELNRIEFLENTSRAQAKRSRDPIVIEYDPSSDQFTILKQLVGQETAKVMPMAGSCDLTSIRLPNRDWNTETTQLLIAPSGESATYGLKFESSSNEKEVVIVVSGVTGQWIRCENEEEADELFRLLETPRLDTH